MDTDPISPPATPRSGGAVEPLNRGGPAKEHDQAPKAAPTADRYELRDPFAEVTYRSDSLSKIVAKAQRLGSTRVTAVDPEGHRTPVIQVDGQWSKQIPQQLSRAGANAGPSAAR